LKVRSNLYSADIPHVVNGDERTQGGRHCDHPRRAFGYRLLVADCTAPTDPNRAGLLAAIRVFRAEGRLNQGRLWHIWLVILGGGFAMLKAPSFDGRAVDLLPFEQEGLDLDPALERD
jgi:hypothetical protein